MKRAALDIKTARRNLDFDCECSYEYAYNAMLRSSLALMRYNGYRPNIKNKHINVILFAEAIIGSSYESLIIEYDIMRKQRNKFIYEPGRPCTRADADMAISVSRELCFEIRNHMPDLSSQIEFDF